MNRKLSFWILGCVTLSLAVVVILIGMSGVLKDRRNSFLRLFPPHPVMEGDTLDIRYNNYYIAGLATNTLYLGNYQAPLHVLQVDLTRMDTQHVSLKVKGIHDHHFKGITVQVDSPYYYLSDGTVPVIFRGNVHDWKAERILQDRIFFREIASIKPGTFAVKSLSGFTGENILGKINTQPTGQCFAEEILEKQIDGVFCTDGALRFNKEHNRVVYTYYYRNQFMVADTMLHLIYRGNTIDTTTHARIAMATLKDSSKILSTPPFFVNRMAETSGQWLFVQSGLMARNESEDAFDDGSVIDVYSIQDGKYHFSFYIYNLGSRKMTAFAVSGMRMAVLYDKAIRVFNLVPRYFTNDMNGSTGHPEEL
jgi:hypothetical protein